MNKQQVFQLIVAVVSMFQYATAAELNKDENIDSGQSIMDLRLPAFNFTNASLSDVVNFIECHAGNTTNRIKFVFIPDGCSTIKCFNNLSIKQNASVKEILDLTLTRILDCPYVSYSNEVYIIYSRIAVGSIAFYGRCVDRNSGKPITSITMRLVNPQSSFSFSHGNDLLPMIVVSTNGDYVCVFERPWAICMGLYDERIIMKSRKLNKIDIQVEAKGYKDKRCEIEEHSISYLWPNKLDINMERDESDIK